MKQLTQIDFGKILAYREQGFKIRQISEILNVPKSTIANFLQRYKKNRTTLRKLGSGRPKKLKTCDISLIKSELKLRPRQSAPKLAEIIKQKTGKIISRQTIGRELNNLGLFAYSPIKKAMLSKKNILARYSICLKWNFLADNYWENVIFSDECKFNLYNSDGNTKIWRKHNEGLDNKYTEKTVKFNKGNIMIWGCVSSKGLGDLVFIEGIMDKIQYVSILANNLKNYARKMNIESFVFQQDNDPKHRSKMTMNFFESENINLLEWPSQSPDLNPIEHIWAFMKKKLCGKNFSTKDDLKKHLKDLWSKIPEELVVKVIKSMPRRIKAVLRAKGNATKY